MHLRYCLSIMNVAAIVLLLPSTSKLEAQTQATSAAPVVFHLLDATIDDVQTALRSGRLTCRELVELYLKRIAAYDKSGPGLNAVQTINPRALEEADRLDAAFKASGPIGALTVFPFSSKINLRRQICRPPTDRRCSRISFRRETPRW
jgi:hypothetical protein